MKQGLEAHRKVCGHPGVAQLFGAYTDKEYVYILTEFLEGGALSTCLARGRLSNKQGARLAVQVASALSHCHKLGKLFLKHVSC